MFALGGAYAFVRRDVDGQISVRPLTGPPPAMSGSVRVSLTSAFTNRLRVKGMDRCNFEDRCYFSAERALGSVRVGFLIRRAELPKRELVRNEVAGEQIRRGAARQDSPHECPCRRPGELELIVAPTVFDMSDQPLACPAGKDTTDSRLPQA